MNVRCPVCGSSVKLAVGDTQLACTACGLAAPLSHVGTAPGTPPSTHLALETDLTGETIAGKKLIARIGAGGMGTVYRARGEDNVEVAVKVLRAGLGTDRTTMLARFSREAEALRRLEHARIVRLHDHGEQRDIAYIVTELIEGRDLAARLAAGRMSFNEIVDVFGQVCDGVEVAHAAGIVHRDLKPANILVGKDGVKVADFGLAQLGADVAIPTLTRTNVAMGTFHYLAPEQRKDARAVDHRADIWALGVILYEMLTGDLPLGSFVPPSALGPQGCDRRVDAIVNRALAPDPAERYASAADLARDVRKLVAPRKLERFAIAGAAILALAGTSTAIAFGMSSSSNDDTKSSATSINAAPSDAAVLAIADAAIAAPPDATEIAATPRDAATVAAVPGPKPVPVAPVKPTRKRTALGGKTGSGTVPVRKPPPVKHVGSGGSGDK